MHAGLDSRQPFSTEVLMRLIGLAVVLTVGLTIAPLSAEAQQTGKVYRVGILISVSAPFEPMIGSFRHRLSELGYEENKTLLFEYRWAEGKLDRLPGLAAELVALRVDVIVTHGDPGARAAKEATTTIPIVVATMSDPVRAGLAASLAKPGGNLTGFSVGDRELTLKRFELLKEVAPKASRLGYLFDPAVQTSDDYFEALQTGARSLGVRLQRVNVRTVDDFAGAFSTMAKDGVNALSVANIAWLNEHSAAIAALAVKHRLPTIGAPRWFAEGGGLLAYGSRAVDLWRRAASYVDRILKGAKPADLPIEQPIKFELVINMKTAKALGLRIPHTLLLQADQVIQ
jgi:putative tryptophan/tyrosine transport system substrate-binding protein